MTLHVTADDATIEDVGGREQRHGAVPLIVMRHGAEPPLLHRQAGLGVQALLARSVPKLRHAILIPAFTGSREIEIEHLRYEPRDDHIIFPLSSSS